MAVIRQILLGGALLAAVIYVWAAYVPAAGPVLERLGLTDLLGIEVATAEDGEGRGWGGGGPAQVVVAAVTAGAVDDRIEAIGDGHALRSVTLRPEVSGQIRAMPLEGGSYVEEGDVVLRFDAEAERIALERARLMLDEAREEAARLERLGDTGAVTQVRLREARLALRTAELERDQAEYDLDQRTVRAPISGWVGVLDVAVGDRLSSQDAIGTITDRSAILIDFRVPERVVGQIALGSEITARPLGIPDLRLTGQISAIDNVVDSASRTLRLQGRVANAEDRLRAGMAFKVEMRFPGETLPVVDPLSVQWSSEGSYVWVVREGKAARVPITIRQRNADSVVVEADLATGELVVTEGVQNLRPGAAVSVVSDRTAAGAAIPGGRARL